jgi:hypothetical protein
MRPGTPHWQCACSIGGKQRRSTTKEESLARAKDVARDWYLTLMGKYQAGGLRDGKTFHEAADRFMDEYETLNRDQRSAIYIKAHRDRLKNHLKPFFSEMVLSEITAGRVQDYRIHRTKTGRSRIDQLKLANWEKAKAEAIKEAKRLGQRPPIIEPLKDDHTLGSFSIFSASLADRIARRWGVVVLVDALRFALRHRGSALSTPLGATRRPVRARQRETAIHNSAPWQLIVRPGETFGHRSSPKPQKFPIAPNRNHELSVL